MGTWQPTKKLTVAPHGASARVELTSNTERIYPAEAIVSVAGGANKAMANQLTTVAKERLLDYVDTLSPADLQGVEQAIRTQLDLR